MLQRDGSEQVDSPSIGSLDLSILLRASSGQPVLGGLNHAFLIPLLYEPKPVVGSC